jgi:hypothetical protein
MPAVNAAERKFLEDDVGQVALSPGIRERFLAFLHETDLYLFEIPFDEEPETPTFAIGVPD